MSNLPTEAVSDSLLRDLIAAYNPDPTARDPFNEPGKYAVHAALTELQRLRSEERVWRQMLAFAYSGTNLYGDDGELQDSRLPYPIDYVRDTPEQIQQAIHNRGSLKLQQAIEKHGSYEAMLAAAQQPHEPRGELGWLVEVAGGSGALWLKFSPASGGGAWFRDWTDTASDALRFSRKDDAESYISAHMPCVGARATEHMWCDAPAQPETKEGGL